MLEYAASDQIRETQRRQRHANALVACSSIVRTLRYSNGMKCLSLRSVPSRIQCDRSILRREEGGRVARLGNAARYGISWRQQGRDGENTTLPRRRREGANDTKSPCGFLSAEYRTVTTDSFDPFTVLLAGVRCALLGLGLIHANG